MVATLFLLIAFTIVLFTEANAQTSAPIGPNNRPETSPLVAHQMTNIFGGSHRGAGDRFQPRDLICPATGFYCLDRLVAGASASSFFLMDEDAIIDTGADAANPENTPASSSKTMLDTQAFGGGGDARLFYCKSKQRRPRVVGMCPQGVCVKNYCLGSQGPVRVPLDLDGGDGLYCGRTLNRAVSSSYGYTTSRMTNGGAAHLDDEKKTNPNEYDGYLDGDEFGYRRDHLYYIVGNQGIDLGPCNGRCMRQAPGIPDYCEA
ncbi:hypothetical protein BGW42_002373 [Actinomortierella wolfii]|nr:hypothetical protein BGW42_002373 [Actinomortierella wolfii]